ncbi:MAG: DNA photolyase [Rhizobiales bacterium]|nr:DNA photolyase [Hyphomicrobiales bacterium]
MPATSHFGEIVQATRSEGLKRLTAFVPNAGRAYSATRNSDFGPDDRSNVSTLSPWIRHRLVLEQEVVETVLRKHSFSAAQKFVDEVFWRTYFKGWLEHRPQVWSRYRSDVEQLAAELEYDDELRDRFEAAVGGRTGIECFDAWAHELVDTGYLHNHARMWFASIWIFTLRLPWQLGADFFLRHLLDGDPASNTLGWRWVGGLHTKGKTYLARASNIERFTHGRFNPVGQLATTAPPLTEPDLGPLVPIARPNQFETCRPFALLITEEDCYPENLKIPGKPEALIGVSTPGIRSLLPGSTRVEQFTSAAVQDAVDRCADHFGLAHEHHNSNNWPRTLAVWAKQTDVKTIVTAHVPTGPTADLMAQVKAELHEIGTELVQLRRAYDEAVWPHANRGFFGLKSKIPKLLSELNLVGAE